MPLPSPRSRSNHTSPGWWVFLLVIPVSLHADPITLVLKNGDRISGNVQSESPETVTIESLLGPLKIPAGMIVRRESAAVQASSPPGAPTAPLPKGTAAPLPSPAHPLPGSPQSAHSNDPARTNHGTISPVAIPAVSPTTNGWNLWNQAWMQPLLTNWHGNIQLGMDLGFGTAERRTFYANGTANHTWNRVRDLLEYHVAYGIVNKLESANKMDGSIKTDVDLGDKRRLYVYMHFGAGYDSIRHMDLSLDAGPGVGYKFLDRPRLKLSGEVGAQYQKIDYDNSPGKSFFSARLGQSLVWNVWEKLTFTQRLSYLPSVSDPEDYRIRFDLTAAYPVFKKVTISLNIIDQYESRPTISVHNNDLGIQSTLGLTF